MPTKFDSDNHTNFLWGYNIYSEPVEKLLRLIEKKIQYHTPFSILSLNTLKLHLGDKTPALKKIFTDFDCIIPDGQSIVLASALINKIQMTYISGMELMIRLIEEADKKNYSLYFLGSPENLLIKVKEKINTNYPGIKKHFYQHGYYAIKNEEKIISDISRHKPDILFIAFGSPRKEEFTSRFYNKLNASVIMGVGGSYEVFVGEKKLDSFTKKIGLRWFVRLLQDPRRLAKRYAVCNSYYLYLVLNEMLKKIFKK